MSRRQTCLNVVVMLAGVPLIASAKGVHTADALASDAELVTLAAELRDLEEKFNAGCTAQDEYDDTPEGKVVMRGINARLERMTKIPAAGLAGVAAKAGRLCWSYQSGSNLMNCEVPLLDSLAEDLARLAPEAVGGAA
jgi:hypothetical protein